MKCSFCGEETSVWFSLETDTSPTGHVCCLSDGCVMKARQDAENLVRAFIDSGKLCRYRMGNPGCFRLLVCAKPAIGERYGLCDEHSRLKCSVPGCTEPVVGVCDAPDNNGVACKKSICSAHAHCPEHSRS